MLIEFIRNYMLVLLFISMGFTAEDLKIETEIASEFTHAKIFEMEQQLDAIDEEIKKL